MDIMDHTGSKCVTSVSTSAMTSSTNNVNDNNILKFFLFQQMVQLQANTDNLFLASFGVQDNMATINSRSSIVQPVLQQDNVSMSHIGLSNVNLNSGITIPSSVHFSTLGQQSSVANNLCELSS